MQLACPPCSCLLLPALCSSLYFYCNRPTVAAIIAMGVDVGAAASAAFDGSEEGTAAGAAAAAAAGDGAAAPAAEGAEGQEGQEGQEGCQVEGEPAAVAQAASLAQGAAPIAAKVEQASWAEGVGVEMHAGCYGFVLLGARRHALFGLLLPRLLLLRLLPTMVPPCPLPPPQNPCRSSWCGPAAVPQRAAIAPPSASPPRWARCKCGSTTRGRAAPRCRR